MRARVRVVSLLLTAFATCLVGSVGERASAQAPTTGAKPAVTTADYARAEKFLGGYTSPLVLHGAARPTWLPGEGDRFWYRVVIGEGGAAEFVLVDAAKGTKAPAFDHARVAASLSAAAGVKCDAAHLPFTRIVYSADGHSIAFTVNGHGWTCDVNGASCAEEKGKAGLRDEAVSPDGKLAAFILRDNLWVRDLSTGAESQLTTDGVKDFGYATDNAGWATQRPPDSALVARLEEDRHLPAGPARRRRHVPRRHARSGIRRSRPGSIRCPATAIGDHASSA